MEGNIQSFISYLSKERDASYNTQISYERDLRKLKEYLANQGITKVQEVGETSLNSYVLFLEKEGKAASTVSRYIASWKGFFEYCLRQGIISVDPADRLKPPKVEKKFPQILTIQETQSLMEGPDVQCDKGVRDRAMLELLYATGIRVSELLSLKVEDMNLGMEYVICHEKSKDRIIPFGSAAKEALKVYLEKTRGNMVGEGDNEYLFVNCSGKPMSRQGFWKLIKFYADKAGIEKEITPHTFRHSFAAHLLEKGADVQSVQKMMGHADVSTTQMYVEMQAGNVRDVYKKFHPRS
jgi:integrase/recombinase XerD